MASKAATATLRTSVSTIWTHKGRLLSHRRPNQSGFTMIEILVVLVLVGLLASLAIVNLGGGREQREMTSKIRELFVLMQTASEQAILNSEELGLVIDEQGYRFVVFDEQEREWKSESARLFQGRGFPEWMSVTLFSEDDLPRLAKGEEDDDDENLLQPDIVFYSSGETTAFELEFVATPSPDRVYRLESDGLNDIEMRAPGDARDDF